MRTHSSMISASKARLRYIGSRAIGFVIRHLSQKLRILPDAPRCTRARAAPWREIKARILDLADNKQILPVWIVDEAQNLPPEFFRDFPSS